VHMQVACAACIMSCVYKSYIFKVNGPQAGESMFHTMIGKLPDVTCFGCIGCHNAWPGLFQLTPGLQHLLWQPPEVERPGTGSTTLVLLLNTALVSNVCVPPAVQ
jgi:hypothetical protein